MVSFYFKCYIKNVSGDTLLTIAEDKKVRVIDLIQANGLENAYELEPGTELVIPTTIPKGFRTYTVQKGDSLYSIAQKLGNVTATQLAEMNGLEINEYIFPEQRIIVPEEGVVVYITKPGDTIKTVAERIGTTSDNLIFYNPNVYLLPEQLLAYQFIHPTENKNII